MTTTNPISCLDRFHTVYQTELLAPVDPEARSESAPNDDYASIGFSGLGNKNQSEEDKRKWANDTKDLAKTSKLFYLFELPLKIISYFVSSSQESDTLVSKGFFIAERLTATIAGTFRNQIYSHKDSKGELDDNVGAEVWASKEKNFGDKKTAWLSKLNNALQTKFRFAVPILGLFNTDLANDIDNAFFKMIDSSWWRKMGLNSGFYPGIVQDLLKKWGNYFTGKGEHPPTWDFVKTQFSKHLENAKKSKVEFKNAKPDERTGALLKWCNHMDQATAIILPFISFPSNLFGDTIRPILRRLDLTGPIRTMIRTLSIADRSLVGINYWFRHYLPETIAEHKQGITNIFKPSNLYLASLVGDVLDLPLTIFDNKINESPSLIQHSVELMRMLKDSAFDMFWSAKRVTRANEILDKLNHKNNKTNLS